MELQTSAGDRIPSVPQLLPDPYSVLCREDAGEGCTGPCVLFPTSSDPMCAAERNLNSTEGFLLLSPGTQDPGPRTQISCLVLGLHMA